ncbi:MAG: hypothetical protein H3Z53_04965 [archaeon]|nr:hypothetical protein [archaeon]
MEITEKIDDIERQIASLRKLIAQTYHSISSKNIVKLKGELKGITVEEEEIEEAKASLFKHRHE